MTMSALRPPCQDERDVLVELRRADAVLRAAVARLREQRGANADEVRGLFVSDREFEELLARPFAFSPLVSGQDPPRLAISSAASSDRVRGSRWRYLLQVFHLRPLEADVLLLCLLPEIDLRYERIYAYLQDDMTRERPCVDLLLNLLCPDLPSRITARMVFLPECPLLQSGLLHTLAHGDQQGISLLGQSLEVEPRVTSFLLDADPSAGSRYLPNPLRLERPQLSLAELTLEPRTLADLGRLERRGVPYGASDPLWIHLQALDEWAAMSAVRALCTAWDLALLRVRSDALIGPVEEVRVLASLSRRESLLEGAAICLEPARPQEGQSVELERSLSIWSEILADHPYPVFWSNWPAAGMDPSLWRRVRVARLTFGQPDYPRRLALWRRALDGVPSSVETSPDATSQYAALSGRYRLDSLQIERAARSALQAAWQRDPSAPLVSIHDLFSAARSVSSGQIGTLARRIEPRHTWEDLVLPADRLAQLHELCDQFRYRPVVYEEWGFARSSSLGRGLSALFAGPTGTGKTMAAEVIANDLELDLFKIDLSGVVSKYIGETEKNLERIFAAAEDSNAILFFDEADALFGKRSETKDAHDRYANIEIAYLLQKIEEYDGVVILTSNLRQNLDEAFLRRLHFAIEFPLPDDEARLCIWKQLLPAGAPLADDVNLADLVDRFKFSGGSIRNVLLNAAFLAARDGRAITMGHLLWAARREFQKLGKLVNEGQFEKRRAE